MKSFLLALVVLLGVVASAEAHGGVVVRRGAFGRSVVVQRGFVPSHNFSRGVFIDPRFDSRGFDHDFSRGFGVRSAPRFSTFTDQFGRRVTVDLATGAKFINGRRVR